MLVIATGESRADDHQPVAKKSRSQTEAGGHVHPGNRRELRKVHRIVDPDGRGSESIVPSGRERCFNSAFGKRPAALMDFVDVEQSSLTDGAVLIWKSWEQGLTNRALAVVLLAMVSDAMKFNVRRMSDEPTVTIARVVPSSAK